MYYIQKHLKYIILVSNNTSYDIYNYIKELERFDIDSNANCLEEKSYNSIIYAEGDIWVTQKIKKV